MARGGRRPTLSMALPGSVVDNAQTLELATAVAGQIARAAAIFRVDEVVVLDDSPQRRDAQVGQGAAFLARVLQYLETPQYLRKLLIPMHPDLRLAGMLPPLDAPHHMRATEWHEFREGVVLKSKPGLGSLLQLRQEAHIPEAVRPGARVTLHMGEAPQPAALSQAAQAEWGAQGGVHAAAFAPPSKPREGGTYWGYQTRIATSLGDLAQGCPFQGGYDLMVGTSEHGSRQLPTGVQLAGARHLLVVFGGPLGLEDCFARDGSTGTAQPSQHFHAYLNTCPDQGSRTIRTEEAILISLQHLRTLLADHPG